MRWFPVLFLIFAMFHLSMRSMSAPIPIDIIDMDPVERTYFIHNSPLVIDLIPVSKSKYTSQPQKFTFKYI